MGNNGLRMNDCNILIYNFFRFKLSELFIGILINNLSRLKANVLKKIKAFLKIGNYMSSKVFLSAKFQKSRIHP